MENVIVNVNDTKFALLTGRWYHITNSGKYPRVMNMDSGDILPSKRNDNRDRWFSEVPELETIMNYNHG